MNTKEMCGIQRDNIRVYTKARIHRFEYVHFVYLV